MTAIWIFIAGGVVGFCMGVVAVCLAAMAREHPEDTR